MRFRMLETLREYAAEQLTAEESADLRQRHAAHFLALAEEAALELRGAEQARWLERLDAEQANLRAALASCLAEEVGLRLCAALWRFWSIRGHADEGRRAVEQALARAPAEHPELGSSAARARCLDAAGALAHDQGDYAAAAARHEESLSLWRRMEGSPEAREGLATALNNLANACFDQGDLERAAGAYGEALALYRALEDLPGAAAVLSNLGALAEERGDAAGATGYLAESLKLNRALGSRYGAAIALENLGNVERRRGQADRAAACHEEALILRRELGHTHGIAMSLNNLGHLLLARGDVAAAGERLRESLSLFIAVKEPRGLAECLAGLASVAAAGSEPERAARLYGAAAAHRERHQLVSLASEVADEEEGLAAVRAALGEGNFAAAWEAGRAMTLDQALACA